MFRIVCLSAWMMIAAVPAGADDALPAPSEPPDDDALPRPQFDAETLLVADEGHALIRWTVEPALDETWTFELQQADNAEFTGPRARYRGPDTAVFVSGLPERTFYFRVRTLAPSDRAGTWSEPLEVAVEYPSRARVRILLITGAIVFVLTLIAVIRGHTRHRHELASSS